MFAPVLVVAQPAQTARAATPTAVVTKAKKKHKTWAQRHKVGLKAVAVARKQKGKWYRYGGAGPKTFDCSGLVQYVYRKAGVRLPRVVPAQYRAVHRKIAWKHLAAGDLVTFSGKGHIGIVSKVKGHKIYMIHAPQSGQKVKEVRIDNNSYRRSHFSGAVRPY